MVQELSQDNLANIVSENKTLLYNMQQLGVETVEL